MKGFLILIVTLLVIYDETKGLIVENLDEESCHRLTKLEPSTAPIIVQGGNAICTHVIDLDDNSTELQCSDVDMEIVKKEPMLLESIHFYNISIDTMDEDLFGNTDRSDISNVRALFWEYSSIHKVKTIILPNVKVLKLRHNGIEQLDDNAFGYLDLLCILDLSFNNISEIGLHINFPSHKQLTVLNLNYNSFEKMPYMFLTELSALNEFYIRGNRLTEIGKFSWYPSVEILDLSENRITTIENRTFENYEFLEKLYLNDNKIVKLTHQNFFGLKNLKELYLQKNLLAELEENLLVHTSQLIEVDFSFNPIREVPKYLLKFTPNLKSFKIAHTKIIRLNNMMFAFLPDLKYLDVSGNFGLDGGVDAFDLIPNLEHLNLSGTHSQILPRTLQLLKNLKFLNMNDMTLWKCNCENQWLSGWSKTMISKIENNKVCFNATSNRNESFIDYFDRLHCAPDIVYTTPGAKAKTGDYKELECVVYTHPQTNITWILPNGEKVNSDTSDWYLNFRGIRVYEDGKLIIPYVTISDHGYYICKAGNMHGNGFRRTFIEIKGLPHDLYVRNIWDFDVFVTFLILLFIPSTMILYMRKLYKTRGQDYDDAAKNPWHYFFKAILA